METQIERCAGLDVHKKSVTACVRVPGKGKRRHKETRSFTTTTRGLLQLRDWLAEQQVTVVGMESTSSYWKPVYYLLEDDFEVWLLNARHLKTCRDAKPTSKTRSGSRSWSSMGWCAPVSYHHRRSAS